MDTIFALSSGAPPAGIAVFRISGPLAGKVPECLGAQQPKPRRAALRQLYDDAGDPLDTALVLWMPGPGTVTGEDLCELHCHGGRALVAKVEGVLGAITGFRGAEPGEFTRRAFANGRIDLAEAEGLGDLLEAETDLQLQVAQAMAGGALSRQVDQWRERVLELSARIETMLDFSDEDDAEREDNAGTLALGADAAALFIEMEDWLNLPRAEALKEGFRVVMAGPPNSGKSSLFNALIDDNAAIATPIAGTTRDVLQRPAALSGVPFIFIDTAGLHDGSRDAIEKIGIARAREEIARADLVLWLGDEGAGPAGALEICTKCDLPETCEKLSSFATVSAKTGAGIAGLRDRLVKQARQKLPKGGQVALNRRQHGLLRQAADAIGGSMGGTQESAQNVYGEDVQNPVGSMLVADPLLAAEQLRIARGALDQLTGQSSTENMLDTLFTRFCIGK